MRPRVLAGPGLVLVAAVLALAAPAAAQDDDLIPLTREVEGSAERLGRIRDEIAGVRAELDSLSGRREHADRELKRITREIGLVKELLAGLDQRERILELQRDTLEVRLVAQREVHGLRKEALASRLRALYQEGPQRDLELILTSESFSSLVARFRFNTILARLDGNLVARTREQARRIEAEQRQLQSALAGIWEAREEARREKERLAMLEAERIGLLREVESEQERMQNELADLRRQERRLAELMAELEAERRRAPVTPPDTRQDVAPFGDRRGDLPWPVSGTVVREFGRNVHPRFGTVTMHNGVTLAAATGAPVYAVAPGVVQFADHLPGYGRCVILDHGSGYYTLYANLARIFPLRGTRVSGGEILAEVGAADQTEQPELYFEVREGRDARDPRQWLRRLR
ncbi:peptidoglycan DD-metalloendopeptidase family protein [bacterium]|nr:peptidoglycan DD-metalloendopeptidase family protein [bacterium]